MAGIFGPKDTSLEGDNVVNPGSPGRSGYERDAHGGVSSPPAGGGATGQSPLAPAIERATRVTGVPLLGKGPIPPDSRKFKHDRLLGRVGRTPWTVTKDDRMSADEAGDVMQTILKMYGLDRAEEKDIEGFISALFFAHTVNSGSTLQPGRAIMRVGETSFNFADIVRKLGVDLRRFFRAFANEIREVNNEVLKSYDPYDPVSAEYHGWLMQVATERGLQRYPHLAHDSADACTDLSPSERAAVAASKRTVLATVENSADSLAANPRVGVGRYNSTTLGMEFGKDTK